MPRGPGVLLAVPKNSGALLYPGNDLESAFETGLKLTSEYPGKLLTAMVAETVEL